MIGSVAGEKIWAGKARLFAFGLLVILTASSLFLLVSADPARSAATFTVNLTDDSGDSSTADNICDSDAGTTGEQCTLRAAIQQANATAGADTINFDIPGSGVQKISPASALPAVTDPLTIDGTTQPGFSGSPLIELDGSGAGTSGVDGLTIRAGSSTVKGLVINRFSRDGISLETAGGNTIEGNVIGTDATGTTDLGNSNDGVQVHQSDSNTIGGTTGGAGNLISGNDNGGVRIQFSSGNVVQGNRVGTGKNSTACLGNNWYGLFLSNASSSTIGGTASGAANTIACSVQGDGVVVGSGSFGNSILSNSIFSNAGLGIDLSGGTENASGVTANDDADPDFGPNGLQNYPVISSARIRDSKTVIKGTLNSTSDQDFTLQFFVGPRGTREEGRQFIGQLAGATSVTTNAQGKASFSIRTRKVGGFVTATATDDSSGDTSEFSAPRRVKRVR